MKYKLYFTVIPLVLMVFLLSLSMSCKGETKEASYVSFLEEKILELEKEIKILKENSEDYTNDDSISDELCKSEEAKDFVRSFKLIFEEFKDTYELAKSTSKISIPPFISDMQEQKRNIERLELPENCDEYFTIQTYSKERDEYFTIQTYSIERMEKAIDAFIEFQTDGEYILSLLDSADKGVAFIDNWIIETEKSFKEE